MAAGARSSIGATRGSTNRFSDMSGSTGKSASTGSARTSGAISSSNLGSTSGSLINSGGGPSGGGGGGGGDDRSDFMLVLVKCIQGGNKVKAGEVVAEFDRQYQLNRLDDYKAALVQYEANIKKIKADQAVAREAHEHLIEAAKADWEKTKLDLQTVSVRSAIEAETFKLAEQEAASHYKQVVAERKEFEVGQVAELRRAELDRDKSKIELQRAEANVNLMVMKTPIDGIAVMQTITRHGESNQVRQGDQVYSGMSFMTIVDPGSMILNANVNQVDSETLRVGMKATVRLDAYPDLALPATIVAVGAMTDAGGWRVNWVRQIPVRLKLDQMDARVIPDLSASADVQLAEERQVPVAPLESVFRDSPEGRPYVYVQASTGFEKREVELGLTSYVAAAIRSGVRQGEVVALSRPYLPAAVRAGAS
jgi:HlyD family secretion protein